MYPRRNPLPVDPEIRLLARIRSPTTETKNHWARDDPGFAVLQAFFLVVSDIAACEGILDCPAP